MKRPRALLFAVLLVPLALAALGYGLYAANEPPVVPPLSVEDTRSSPRPFVIKLHAQWCAVCMITKDAWARIEETYSGRVHLLVLDFTTEARTNASRAEAARLGLDRFFEEYSGATGTVVVLDGRTKEVRASLGGNRSFADYRAAIDAALH